MENTKAKILFKKYLMYRNPILFVYKNLTVFREQGTGNRQEFQFFIYFLLITRNLFRIAIALQTKNLGASQGMNKAKNLSLLGNSSSGNRE